MGEWSLIYNSKMAQKFSGSLIIRPISAKLERDIEALTTMDPYCIIKIGSQEIKSDYCVDGGKNPHWDEQMNFVISGEDTAYIGVWDKRSLRADQEIAGVIFPLYKLYESRHYEDWLEIMHDGRRAGVLRLHMEFRPTAPAGGLGLPGQQAFGYQTGVQQGVPLQGVPQQGFVQHPGSTSTQYSQGGYQGGLSTEGLQQTGLGSGLQGSTGLTGGSGFQGQSGLLGQSGLSGQSGLQRETGLIGQSGFQGQSGLQGQSGHLGQQGYTEFMQTKTEGGVTEVLQGVTEPGYTEVGYVKVKETTGESGLLGQKLDKGQELKGHQESHQETGRSETH